MHAKGVGNDVEFCEQLLEVTDVALVPGSVFGAPGHLRMSFAAAAEMFDVALSRIGCFMAA
jgi:aspartate aminotransferase